MESIRQRQVAELVKRHFSMILQEEGSYIYGREVLVSVTNVIMSPDLSMAKIYISVYNTENKQATLLELEEEIARLRHTLGARIKKLVRRIPDISLFLDDTIDEMYRVDQLFTRLQQEGQMGHDVA